MIPVNPNQLSLTKVGGYMGIFSRFTDIVNSNISALLDKAEDPQKMVRLIIQEMEDTLVEVRSTSARVLADKKTLSLRFEKLNAAIIDWQQKAELALSKNREDLAKAALVEKQTLTNKLTALAEEQALVDEQIQRLSSEVNQLQDKLMEAKNRQKTICMRHQVASSRLNVKQRLATTKIDDALFKFAQYEQKVVNLEAQIESYELTQKTSAKSNLVEEFNSLQTEDAVDKELAEMKAKLASEQTNRGEKQ